jgi:hypothetical protein
MTRAALWLVWPATQLGRPLMWTRGAFCVRPGPPEKSTGESGAWTWPASLLHGPFSVTQNNYVSNEIKHRIAYFRRRPFWVIQNKNVTPARSRTCRMRSGGMLHAHAPRAQVAPAHTARARVNPYLTCACTLREHTLHEHTARAHGPYLPDSLSVTLSLSLSLYLSLSLSVFLSLPLSSSRASS